MKADWVREIRDDCIRSGVPFFFKQWGGVFKKQTGRLLDNKTWDQMPDFKAYDLAQVENRKISTDLDHLMTLPEQ